MRWIVQPQQVKNSVTPAFCLVDNGRSCVWFG
ncbi:hypothetical protein QOZ95_002549 [Paenibacillus brasilensis]|uniref:Uncharacterized protein n=1 Tax=Paenibacillus brasilensis TaxID=128574 RepID=A0ABU0KY70_9BACL|nr:hypothetical protein [Paenibacillus brasilensis]